MFLYGLWSPTSHTYPQEQGEEKAQGRTLSLWSSKRHQKRQACFWDTFIPKGICPLVSSESKHTSPCAHLAVGLNIAQVCMLRATCMASILKFPQKYKYSSEVPKSIIQHVSERTFESSLNSTCICLYLFFSIYSSLFLFFFF